MNKSNINYKSLTINQGNLKIALVSDWIIGGGAEKVVLELHNMFPDASIYTSYCTAGWHEKLNNKVITGYLQHWPLNKLRKFIPLLRYYWFKNLKIEDADFVISVTGNGEAKAITTPKNTIHISYCNTPVHFYWRHCEQYLKNPGFGLLNPLARFGLKILVKPLSKLDLKSSKNPDYLIANSTHIKNDIKKYYNRDSVVIHPPVDTERFHAPYTKSQTPRSGFVTVGRLVPNKRVDILINACNELNKSLTIVGKGPELKKLQKIAGPNINFIKNASDTDVAQYLASAEAFLFASFEDFGIAPVEAMASGTPVISYKAGGALDYVVPGKTGEFFDEQTTESLVKILQNFDLKKYSSKVIKSEAQNFSTQIFHDNMKNLINNI